MSIAVLHIEGMCFYERMNKRAFSFITGKKGLGELRIPEESIFPCCVLSQPALRGKAVASSTERNKPQPTSSLNLPELISEHHKNVIKPEGLKEAHG